MNLTAFTIFLRNISKHKIVSVINIIGLVLGITSTVLILEYVCYERSYDAYHKNADDIYRVAYDRYRGNTLLWKTANSFFPTGSYLKKTYPEVDSYFNISRKYNIEVSAVNATGTKVSFFEEKAFYASSSIFSILSLPLKRGSVNCLEAPNTVAISEKAAKKYFNGENPVGKVIVINDKERYSVTGVYKDIPSNTNIKADLFFSFNTILDQKPALKTNWSNDGCHTYLKLVTGTDYKLFEKKAFKQLIADNYKNLQEERNERDYFYLQPIKSIHLNSAIEYETETPGSGKAVNILFGFSLFFIIIAWINYINLVTARSVERAKEIGIRKVTGASKLQIIWQFVLESIFFNLICLLLSVVLILLLNSFFKQLTGIEEINLFKETYFGWYAFAIFITGVLLSSVYPALVLSSYKPAMVLKGDFKNSKQGFLFRKCLVSFQFFVSVSLLIGTVVIYNQVKFLSEKDKGYDISSTFVFKSPRINESDSVYQTKVALFRDKLGQIPGVNGFTFISDIPGQETNGFYTCYRKGGTPNEKNAHFRTDIDPDFINFFKIKLLAGRNFTVNDDPKLGKVMINVKALKRIAFSSPEDAVGKMIITGGDKEREIIGVVADINYVSAKVEAVPTVYTNNNPPKRYMAVKYQDKKAIEASSVIERMKSAYFNVFPGSAIEYFPLEDKVELAVKPDQTFAFIFGLFSILAVIIGIIGVLGLVIITINQNIKEMGVRKTLGAGTVDFATILSRKFMWQFVVAVVVALPVSFYVYQKWVLESYVYHIDFQWIFLILPVFVIVVLITITITLVSVNVSRIRPVEALRYE